MNNDIAILVITYNRVGSLKRLIYSLINAEYLGDSIDLIISVDYSELLEIKDYIHSIVWPHGNLVKVFHKKNLGLKEHIIKSGKFTEKYKNICVFEDDIFVSKGYYIYAKQTINYYKDDDDIAGISLYQYEWNQYANLSFNPLTDGHDVYFLQIASSWGQIWSRDKWKSFNSWMQKKSEEDLFQINGLPECVAKWSSKSWLKYHHAYLVDTNKFFVYPRTSLSTNFSDVGEHAFLDSTYQVNLQFVPKSYYKLCKLSDGVRYDGYYENLDLTIPNHSDLTVDLYGTKTKFKKHLLSTQHLPYKVDQSFALRMRPHELNIINQIDGNDVFLYNTEKPELRPTKNILTTSNKDLYYFHINSRHRLPGMLFNTLYKAFKRKLTSIFPL